MYASANYNKAENKETLHLVVFPGNWKNIFFLNLQDHNKHLIYHLENHENFPTMNEIDMSWANLSSIFKNFGETHPSGMPC